MIKSIKIKNVATFNNEGIAINDLKRINFIYGGNGTGKTTIANFLSLQGECKDPYNDCSIEWQNESHEDILVYSKNFREENIVNTNGLPGVFTLGIEAKEAWGKIDTLKKELNRIDEEINSLENSEKDLQEKSTKHDDDLRNKLWTSAFKKYGNYSEALTGFRNSKEKFMSEVIRQVESLASDSNDTSIPNDIEMEKRYDLLFSNVKSTILPLIDIPVEERQIAAILNDEIWKTKIIGKEDIKIGKLINKLGSSDWVLKGRQYIEDDICPFCQQHTISDVFRKQLEEYFDDSFNESVARLKNLANEFGRTYKTMIENYKMIVQQNKTFLDIEDVENQINQMQKNYEYNNHQIEEKIKEPGRTITLKHFSDNINKIKNACERANQKISDYNETIQNKASEREKFKELLWKKIAIQAKDDVNEYKKNKAQIDVVVRRVNSERRHHLEENRKLSQNIDEIESEITSIKPTIISINKTLNTYGYDSFTIVESDKAGNYQIRRADGKPATKTLSEGELTFISFLYFMQLANGSIERNKISDNRILVIDDPISSLDSSALFVVSSMIKEHLKKLRKDETYVRSNVKQVILLTHNVYFHKDVTFFNGRNTDNNTNFWILRKNKHVSEIKDYGPISPIRSSYELLWRELKVSKGNGDYISIPNIMRRILETYFCIFGGWKDEAVLEKIADPEKKEIARTLMVWSNEGSHSVFDDLEVEQPDTMTEKFYETFRLIFDEAGQISHYNMMMEKQKDV